MSRLVIPTNSEAQNVVEGLYKDLERRIIASPPGLCPVDLTAAFLKMCHAQTCGKCVPCRIGLAQLSNLLEDILNGKGTTKHLTMLEETARVIESTADCAIGYTAAQMVLKGLDGFKEDFMEHILHNRCRSNLNQPVPCVALCPAGVDIPGYIALTGEGRYADAVRLIRKDNPFPTACALVCEHPCESRCRRNMLDNSINIRGIKRVAVDMAGHVPAPVCPTSTGKRIAIIGGGPSGLSAAYYLQLMGHQTTVFEKRKKLGGMLLYGIPSYRLPRERLQDDINVILETGVEVLKLRSETIQDSCLWMNSAKNMMLSTSPSALIVIKRLVLREKMPAVLSPLSNSYVLSATANIRILPERRSASSAAAT